MLLQLDPSLLVNFFKYKIGIKFQLSLFYDSKKKDVMEVEYQFISIDPSKFKLHDSMKV